MGVFEIDAFSRGTISLAHDIANCYAMTIVGGGDTDVAIHKTGETERITYISTGGGAFLYLLEGKVLPAVAALDLQGFLGEWALDNNIRIVFAVPGIVLATMFVTFRPSPAS